MKVLKRDPELGYVDSLLWIPKSRINVEGTKRALTFSFLEQQTITSLCLWKETDHHLLVPREFWEVKDLDFPVIDARPRSFPSVTIPSLITLDFLSPTETVQRDALNALMNARGGILQLACGKGKTCVALELASRMGVPTLVLVDNTQLLNQWREAILGDGKNKPPMLDLKPEEVGLIQAEVFDWEKPIVLATYKTMANRAEHFPEEVRRRFGLIIWDEGHHIAAPTFSKTADLFYGYRLALTATPVRDDGLHIIYDFHLGKVIFKDLKQELRPQIYFMWTGFEVNLENMDIKSKACDKNGELHISKLASYLGQYQERLDLILSEVDKAVSAGRKIIVLSSSVDELINLVALRSKYRSLYTDIPVPTEKDVGCTTPAIALGKKDKTKIYRVLPQIRAQLKDPSLNPVKRENLAAKKAELEYRLNCDEVASKIAAEIRRRQRAYLKDLLAHVDDAGLMIYRVSPKARSEMLKTKKVTFAISKYGREGLDEQTLDTILVCEPFSSRNVLQQVMGRIQRKKGGKKDPIIIFLEDNIGPMMGMCQKLRKALREWPVDENGPYDYEMVGYPVKPVKGSAMRQHFQQLYGAEKI